MLQFGDNGLLKKSKEAVDKSKLAQTEELIKMDLLAAYIDAELTGLDKPTNETIKSIVEKHGGTIDERNPNVIQTPNGEIKLDEILNDTSSDAKDPDEINQTVEELNKQINELKGQLATESNKREELETQITELQTQVADWKKKAEDGEVTLEEKNTEISNLNNQITAKNAELDEKNNEIQELNESVTTITSQKDKLETQVANLEGEITEKDQTIADKEGTITSLNTRIDELNTSITDLNGQLTQANSDKQALQDEVTSLNGQVASWKKKAEDGEATIAQRDATISSLNDQITAKNADITSKTQTINDLNGQITTLTTQKNSLETQVANLQKTQATGNATVADVLAGKTFSNGSGVGLTGTMANRGTLSKGLKEGETLTLEAGYYSGGTISSIGKSIETVKAEIERDGLASHLGDLVDYAPEGKGKWRVFYYNTTEEWGDPVGTLYLKRDYDDSLQKQLSIPDATTNGTNYMKKMNPLWAASENATSIDLNNEKAVAWLCDPDNWKEYQTGSATYAIGSPSVEMYMKSYNVWKNSNNALTCGIKNTNGYGVAANGGTLSYNTPLNSVEAGPGTMYMTKNKNWWLASPSGGSDSLVCYVRGDRAYVRGNSYSNTYGVCPVVSINP